jgi:hypothetical protein
MKLTNAVSNIARSGATRSGYPVLQGAKVPLYAISNLARSGATRSNYTGSQPFISIDGIHRGWGRLDGGGVIADSVTKSDAINNTPVTLTFTAYGWVPIEGADVVVTLGSKNNLQRQFGGTILSTRHRYAKKPVDRNMLYDVSCIDYTWALDRRKVSGNYTNASVAAIAASLMTSAPAGYTLRVDPDIGAERLDQITFTEQSLTGAFAQLAKRVGGDFLCDYLKVVHLFFENTALTAPRIVNAVHPTLQTIDWTRDLSQVATRILGNFGGSNALDQIGPGETLLPVETAAWYLAAGGVVLVGQQRVTYAGLDAGGGGSLVGPGAAPTGTPNASLLPGAGVDVGTHDYAVTFKTTNGESIPGPRLTVPVGVFLPPATAPTAGTPTAGSGPDAGVHDYAISFVISTGETVPGPRIAASTALLDPPTTAPTPDRVDPGPGPDPGAHDYAVAFVLYGSVATTPGPIGGQITTGPIADPANAPSAGSVTAGPGPDLGTHYYAFTFVRPEGETGLSPLSGPATTGIVAPPTTAPNVGSTAAGGGIDDGSHAYACTFVRSGGETTPGPIGPTATSGNFGPPTSAPSSAPTCQQYPSQGNYTPGANSGRVGDAVAYALAYATDNVNYSDLSTMGPSSGQQTIQPALAGAPNCCRRTVTIPASGPSGSSYRLYVSVNGGSWTCLQFGANPTTTPLTIEVAGQPANFGVYPGPGHGPVARTFNLVNLPTSADATVTARKLYRQSGGAGLKLLATISDNTTRTYTDTTPNASLGAVAPSVNGTLAATVHVSGIQTGPGGAGVIGRKLYRYTNVGTWGLVGLLNDNTTTSYTDTTLNASLGAAPPGANTTTGGNQTVHLSGLPTVSGPNGAGAWRQLYRRSGGAGLRFVANIPDNTTRTYTDTTPNASLSGAPSTVNNAVLHQIPLTKIPIGNALVVSRKVYRTPANTAGGPLQLVTTIADNTTTDVIDTVPDASLGALALTVGTAQAAQVQLSAIPLGAASVIARGLYRTKAGLIQLQAIVILGDNTTTTYLDIVADAALGANAPTSDTSLLQQPTGNVLAGSPTLPCATVAAFRPTGGWAIVGSQNVRYTGISGNALLGIPPSGPGAITATITYNTTVVAAAMLTGIPATGLGVIKYQILKGDPVNLFVQVDDLDAQAAVRLQLAGSDGIIEDEIQDGRLSYLEGVARCQARLDLLAALDSEGKVGVITVSYVCRDLNTQAGATVTINLGPPVNLRGDFLIQRVGVARFNIPNLNPTYTVEASSLRFSAEEMLRLLRQGAF